MRAEVPPRQGPRPLGAAGVARPRGSSRQTCLCRAGSGASSSECGAASPEFSFRPCLRGAGASEGASGRFAGAEPRDAPGGSNASRGVAGDGRVAVRGAAAGPVAPGLAAASGRAVGAATPRFGRRDPQPPSRAAAAETQREPGPSARGPGLEEAGRGGGKSGAPPAQVRGGGAGGGRERAATRVRGPTPRRPERGGGRCGERGAERGLGRESVGMPEIPARTLLPGGSTESEPRRSTREDRGRRRAVCKPLGPGRGSKRPGVRKNGLWAQAGKTGGRLKPQKCR